MPRRALVRARLTTTNSPQNDAFAAPFRAAADAIGLPPACTRELKDAPSPELGGRTGRARLRERWARREGSSRASS